MTLHELARPAPTAPPARRVAGILRRLADLWWFGVLTHVAEMNGLPRPREPTSPNEVWPFGHL